MSTNTKTPTKEPTITPTSNPMSITTNNAPNPSTSVFTFFLIKHPIPWQLC